MQTVPERLQSHLEPSERVLWIGSPSPKLLSWRSLFEIVGPALLISLFLGGGVFLFVGLSGDLGETLDAVLGMSTFSLSERWFWVFFLLGTLVMGVGGPIAAKSTDLLQVIAPVPAWGALDLDLAGCFPTAQGINRYA